MSNSLTNRPIKTKGYSSYTLNAKKKSRQADANERQANYDSLTIAEKITLAVQRGGSKKELARLEKKQTKPTAKPVTKTVVTPPPAVPVTVAPTTAPKKSKKSKA